VISWAGGEIDVTRSWRRRDEAVLGGRMASWARRSVQACRSFVASVGGHDTAFILSEGWIASDRVSGLRKKLRGSQLPTLSPSRSA